MNKWKDGFVFLMSRFLKCILPESLNKRFIWLFCYDHYCYAAFLKYYAACEGSIWNSFRKVAWWQSSLKDRYSLPGLFSEQLPHWSETDILSLRFWRTTILTPLPLGVSCYGTPARWEHSSTGNLLGHSLHSTLQSPVRWSCESSTYPRSQWCPSQISQPPGCSVRSHRSESPAIEVCAGSALHVLHISSEVQLASFSPPHSLQTPASPSEY